MNNKPLKSTRKGLFRYIDTELLKPIKTLALKRSEKCEGVVCSVSESDIINEALKNLLTDEGLYPIKGGKK